MKNNFNAKFDHIFKMTTSIGFWQFATGISPNQEFGYSLDDQARALILVLFLYQQKKDRRFLNLAKIYLNFIARAQRADGFFHNFADSKGQFTDKIGSQDSFGRTLWALGLSQSSNLKWLCQRAEKLFKKALPNIKKIRYIRSRAYTALGLLAVYHKKKEIKIEKALEKIITYLCFKFKENSSGNWRFFEKKLVYANAILPYTLLLAAEVLANKDYQKIGLESLNFLDCVCRSRGLPAPIGNQGWYQQGNKKNLFDPQPIDAADMILAADVAYNLTKNKKYLKMKEEWFAWFFGYNIHKLSFYDKKTGGCHDGIRNYKLNPDEGAESTICFHLANLARRTIKK